MTISNTPFDPMMMEMAITLAKRSRPSPNPRVGAVIVKNGKVVGTGYHEGPGMPHAESVAIDRAGENAKDAALYVTLEPCVHHGHTGPCVETIFAAGITRVFIGMRDPDVRVNGKGIAYLNDRGLKVSVGMGKEACTDLLRDYVIHRTFGRPGITLKAAITLDGYLAAKSGESKWISSQESRRTVHEMRANADAVLVGINTVVRDDPLLTVHDHPGVSPLRVVLDTRLRIPGNARLIETADKTSLLLVHTDHPEGLARLAGLHGVETMFCQATADGAVNLMDLVKKLGERGILSLLVEGGSSVFSSFLRARLVDEIVLFIAPLILGGGIPWVTLPNAATMEEGILLNAPQISQISCDLLYRVRLTDLTRNHRTHSV